MPSWLMPVTCFFFQAEDGIRDYKVTGVQTCALPIYGTSYFASVSADGRRVAFDSGASNLVSDDTNGRDDVFVHDRLTGQTIRASVDPAEIGRASCRERV